MITDLVFLLSLPSMTLILSLTIYFSILCDCSSNYGSSTLTLVSAFTTYLSFNLLGYLVWKSRFSVLEDFWCVLVSCAWISWSALVCFWLVVLFCHGSTTLLGYHFVWSLLEPFNVLLLSFVHHQDSDLVLGVSQVAGVLMPVRVHVISPSWGGEVETAVWGLWRKLPFPQTPHFILSWRAGKLWLHSSAHLSFLGICETSHKGPMLTLPLVGKNLWRWSSFKVTSHGPSLWLWSSGSHVLSPLDMNWSLTSLWQLIICLSAPEANWGRNNGSCGFRNRRNTFTSCRYPRLPLLVEV